MGFLVGAHAQTSQFYGVTKIDEVDIASGVYKWDIRVSGFIGGFDFAAGYSYEIEQIDTGAVLFINCHAYTITSVNAVIPGLRADVTVQGLDDIEPPVTVRAEAALYTPTDPCDIPKVAVIALNTGEYGISKTDAACLEEWAAEVSANCGGVGMWYYRSDSANTVQTLAGGSDTLKFISGYGMTVTSLAGDSVVFTIDTSVVNGMDTWLGSRLIAGSVSINVPDDSTRNLVIDTLDNYRLTTRGFQVYEKLSGPGVMKFTVPQDSMVFDGQGASFLFDSTLRFGADDIYLNNVALWKERPGSAPYSLSDGSYAWVVDSLGTGSWVNQDSLGTWLKPALESTGDVVIYDPLDSLSTMRFVMSYTTSNFGDFQGITNVKPLSYISFSDDDYGYSGYVGHSELQNYGDRAFGLVSNNYIYLNGEYGLVLGNESTDYEDGTSWQNDYNFTAKEYVARRFLDGSSGLRPNFKGAMSLGGILHENAPLYTSSKSPDNLYKYDFEIEDYLIVADTLNDGGMFSAVFAEAYILDNRVFTSTGTGGAWLVDENTLTFSKDATYGTSVPIDQYFMSRVSYNERIGTATPKQLVLYRVNPTGSGGYTTVQTAAGQFTALGSTSMSAAVGDYKNNVAFVASNGFLTNWNSAATLYMATYHVDSTAISAGDTIRLSGQEPSFIVYDDVDNKALVITDSGYMFGIDYTDPDNIIKTDSVGQRLPSVNGHTGNYYLASTVGNNQAYFLDNNNSNIVYVLNYQDINNPYVSDSFSISSTRVSPFKFGTHTLYSGEPNLVQQPYQWQHKKFFEIGDRNYIMLYVQDYITSYNADSSNWAFQNVVGVFDVTNPAYPIQVDTIAPAKYIDTDGVLGAGYAIQRMYTYEDQFRGTKILVVDMLVNSTDDAITLLFRVPKPTQLSGGKIVNEFTNGGDNVLMDPRFLYATNYWDISGGWSSESNQTMLTDGVSGTLSQGNIAVLEGQVVEITFDYTTALDSINVEFELSAVEGDSSALMRFYAPNGTKGRVIMMSPLDSPDLFIRDRSGGDVAYDNIAVRVVSKSFYADLIASAKSSLLQVKDSLVDIQATDVTVNRVHLWKDTPESAPYSNPSGTYLWTVDENGQNGAWADAAGLGDGNGIYSDVGTVAAVNDFLVKTRLDTSFAIAYTTLNGFEDFINNYGTGDKFMGFYLSDGYWGGTGISYIEADSFQYNNVDVENNVVFLHSRWGTGGNKHGSYIEVRSDWPTTNNRIVFGGFNSGVEYSYAIPSVAPSTTLNDTTVMAWRGTGSAAEPIGFINKNTFGTWLKPELEAGNVTINTGGNTLELSGYPELKLSYTSSETYLYSSDIQISASGETGGTVSLSLASNVNSVALNMVRARDDDSDNVLNETDPVDSGDNLGVINFQGSSEASSGGFTAAGISAAIRSVATENFGSTAIGAKLIFSTTDNATTTLDDRLIIEQNDSITANTSIKIVRPGITADREHYLTFKTSDATNDLGGIGASSYRSITGTPSFWGYSADSTNSPMTIRALVPASRDASTGDPLIAFQAAETDDATDPNSGTFGRINNRDLMVFYRDLVGVSGSVVFHVDQDGEFSFLPASGEEEANATLDLVGSLLIRPQSSPPTGAEGEFYFDDDTNTPWFHNGSTWVEIGTGGSGESNTASNVGSGTGLVFKQKTGVDLEFKSLLEGTGISITNNASDITLTAAPPINTLVAATNTNTINNTNYTQTWQWNTLSGAALNLSTTSTAAAGNAQALLKIDVSGANATSSQTTYGIQLSNTHTGTSAANIGIKSTATGGSASSKALWGVTTNGKAVVGDASTTGTGVEGTSTSGTGVSGSTQGTAGYGVLGTNTAAGLSGGYFIGDGDGGTFYGALNSETYGGSANASNAIAANFTKNSLAADSTLAKTIVKITNQLLGGSSNTTDVGFGGSLDFQFENTDAVNNELQVAARILAKWLDPTKDSEDGQLEFWTQDDGAAATRKVAISDIGKVTFDTYGVGTHTGTAAKWLAVTSAGIVIEENAPTGGTTNLTFTGASSPYTLNSDTGTDVTFAEGTGITLSRSTNELTIAVNRAATGIYGGDGSLTTDVDITGAGFDLQATGLDVTTFGFTGEFALNYSSAATNTQPAVLALSHMTSGTAATNFGASITYELENASGTAKAAGLEGLLWSDATNASEDADFQIKLMTAGAAAAQKLLLKSTGEFNLNAYGTRTFTGTEAYSLGVTSAGKIIETYPKGVVPNSTETVYTSTQTATKGEILLMDCSAAARTVNPPSSPAIGERFAVSDAKASSSTNNITIDFTTASQKLYGSIQNYVMNTDGAYVEFTYVGSTTGWIATK